MRIGAFLCLVLYAAAGAAQTTFKCVDERRKITYSNIPCEKQGLKDGGAVAERTTTLPMAPARKAAAPAPPAAAAAKGDSEIGPTPSPAQVKPVNPLIEKLLK